MSESSNLLSWNVEQGLNPKPVVSIFFSIIPLTNTAAMQPLHVHEEPVALNDNLPSHGRFSEWLTRCTTMKGFCLSLGHTPDRAPSFVHTHVHTCIYIYICICIYTYMYICICIPGYTYVYTHTHIYIYMYISLFSPNSL